MKHIQALRAGLLAKLPYIVFALILLQPIMDCLSFWVTRMGWSNLPTLLLRFGVLGVTLLLGFFLTSRKRIYWITAAVCFFLVGGHLYAVLEYGVSDLVSDLTNLVRVLQMPLTAICLITFLREREGCYEALKWGMVGSLAVILAVEVLATLTGTEPHTYMDGRGYIGWFNNTNSQSGILCMVVPVAMVMVYEKKGLRSIWFWLVSLGGMAFLFLLGTRLGLFGLVAVGFGLGVSLILIRPTQWKRALAFVFAAVLFVGLLPWSPMISHQGVYTNVQGNRQAIIEERLAAYDLKPLDEPGISAEEREAREALWVEALSYTYSYHARDFVNQFGMEETIEHYHYSKDISEITAQRPKKLLFGQMLMEHSPASAKLFGVELSRFTVGKNNYDVENDLHGIYFLCGAVGLGAMLLFLAYFLWLVVKALVKDAKTYFTLDAAAWGIGLICCLLHVYNTAGILRRPNASFYLAATLAAIYYLVQVKQYPERKPPKARKK